MFGAIPFSDGLIVTLVSVLSPTIVFLTTLSLIFIRNSDVDASPVDGIQAVIVSTIVPRRTSILIFLSLISVTYFLDGMTVAVSSMFQRHWSPTSIPSALNAVIGLSAFGGMAVAGALKDVYAPQVWSLRRIKYANGLSFILDILLTFALTSQMRHSYNSPSASTWPLVAILHLVFPIIRILCFPPLLLSLANPRTVFRPAPVEDGPNVDAELHNTHDADATTSTGLLAVPGQKYGTFSSAQSHHSSSTRPPSQLATSGVSETKEKSDIVLDPSWSEIFRRLRRLTPYLWPSKDRSLQILAVFCVLILIISRGVNAIVPFTVGEIINIFDHRSERSLWVVLGVYVVLRFLQGSGGLASLREVLWIPVMQYSDREMSQLSFNHLLNLSFSYHTKRKTGEVLRVLDRGAAINRTLELLLFNVVPTFIDIGISLIVFCVIFDWTLALVIFVVMFAYVYASVFLTTWRTRMRRQMNERDIVTRGIHTDCLLNYETVKYFCGEEHEAARYRAAILDYQAIEYKVYFSLNVLNLTQNFIITVGLLVGSLIVASRIIAQGSGPRDFVVFITYLAQLYSPLNMLGTVYRAVNQSLVDTEKLLMLLNEPTDINDKPGAPDLLVQDGEIEFQNVSFSYDGSVMALKNVSFKVPKNSSVALVGESGAGKSTVLRLLYRFYDLEEGNGAILIDGKDIRDVTQKSLRQAIGVVPQDAVLFNTSIGYNIGYGKFGASEEEIKSSAISAQMHDRIMTFPKGYDTTVGERGVRLSGGEKQRVSIARTLLKNPPILLLDEATSALDTSTERDIQKALQNLMTGRSSLSIAHRLSTIASADIILVLKDGQIIEQGSHKELLALDGVFAAMWADQISTAEDSEHKLVATGTPTTKEEDTPVLMPQVDNQLVDAESYLPESPPELPPALEEPEVAESPKDEGEVGQMTADTQTGQTEQVAFPSTTDQDETLHFPKDDEPEQVISEDKPEEESSERKDLAFPARSEEEVGTPASPASPAPGVTFASGGSDSPRRSGTPDVDSEPKRKRISSQNFQRLAKRISIGSRKQPSISSILPSLRRDSSQRGSLDDVEAGSPSQAPSESGEGSSKPKRKDKKRKSAV